MRSFLCALGIFALAVLLMVANTCYLVTQIDRMLAQLDALPRAEESDCLTASTALEAQWRRMRPIASLSINIRTIETIDRLTLSVRVSAAYGHSSELEVSRELLIRTLTDLRALVVCDVGEIF